MLPIVVMMIVILILAGLVLAYVAFPHRGAEMPAAPWLGEALGRAADAAPTVDGRSADDANRAGRRDDPEGADGAHDHIKAFFSEHRSGFFS